jgi:hypothetical protein
MTAFIRRYFAGGAAATKLASAMSSTDTSFTILSATGWPGSPGNDFYVVIDRDSTSEEKILCTQNSGTTVTVALRGADGTTASGHNGNAPVEVCITGVDGDEANQVVNLLGNAAVGSIFYGGGAATLPSKLVIGSNSPVLGVSGGVPAWQQLFPSSTISGSNNLAINTSYKVSSGSGTQTLPAPVAGGWIKVTNYGSGVAVVSQHASEKIYGVGLGSGGASSFTVASYGGSATAESDGVSWYITALPVSPANGYGITGNTGATPTPAVALSWAAGSIASNVGLPGSSDTPIFSTASLAVGTWLVNVFVTAESGASASTVEIKMLAGTATATLAGAQSAASVSGATDYEAHVSLSCIAVITVAGTLEVVGVCSTSSGTALAYTTTNVYPAATGYTALKVG